MFTAFKGEINGHDLKIYFEPKKALPAKFNYKRVENLIKTKHEITSDY